MEDKVLSILFLMKLRPAGLQHMILMNTDANTTYNDIEVKLGAVNKTVSIQLNAAGATRDTTVSRMQNLKR